MISLVGQTPSQGVDHIRVQAVVMPMLMGGVSGVIIAYLVARNRALPTDQLDMERRHSRELTHTVESRPQEPTPTHRDLL